MCVNEELGAAAFLPPWFGSYARPEIPLKKTGRRAKRRSIS
jgi:hypothetical protein